LSFAEDVLWTVTDNPSASEDIAKAITYDGSYIYVAGSDFAPVDEQWRIQKRNKSDGSIVWDVNDNPSSSTDGLMGVTCDGDYIYLSGYDGSLGDELWRIQKRNKSDGNDVWTVTDPGKAVPWAITYDDSHVYLAGAIFGPDDNQWKIQKRNASDGNEVWTQTQNWSGDADEAYAITSDDTYIYVAGWEHSIGNYQWRIQKRNKSDGNDVWDVNYNPSSSYDRATSITSDDAYIYVAGVDRAPGNDQWRILKLNKSDGSIVWDVNDDPGSSHDGLMGITCDGNYIWVAGYDSSQGDRQWRIQKRNKSDGSVVWTETENPSGSEDGASGITSDGTRIYVAGYDRSPGDYQWRIQKIGCAMYYVDANDGNDLNDGLTPETAFATIQKGIDEANDCDNVVVYPGLYLEELDFLGKAITVRSIEDAAVITAPDYYAVSFYHEEDGNSVFENFVIADSDVGFRFLGASPTVRYITVADCNLGAEATAGAEPDISRSIFCNNRDGDLDGCQATYSWSVDDNNHFVGEWGGSGSGDGQFNEPHSIAAEASGYVYVSDYANHRVQKFDTLGNFIGWWGGCNDASHVGSGHWHAPGSPHQPESGSGNGEFTYLHGIDVDSVGYIYVSDWQNQRIQKFTSDGSYVRQWGTAGSADGEFNQPTGIGVDPSGYVYVADTANHRVQKFTSDGDYVAQWGSYGSGNGQFQSPYDIGFDSSGYAYVSDYGNNRIQKFTSDGDYVAQWGSYGSGNGQFNHPHYIAVDVHACVYVSDGANDRIQKFTGDGAYLTQWGSSGSGNGQFNGPCGIAVDSSECVYVTDYSNDRVQKFLFPLFADADNGDYHLKSERGRYRATTDEWLLDDATSPCIDAGDPTIEPVNERMPNGGRVNMGAYGNTKYASMSEWTIKGDLDRSGRVDLRDFAIWAMDWLKDFEWAQ
jgi:hypothetical protein